jgi:hypothetical protein
VRVPPGPAGIFIPIGSGITINNPPPPGVIQR